MDTTVQKTRQISVRRYAPARDVCDRYGVNIRTLDRWLAKEEIGFPKPRFIGRMRFWSVSELDEFDAT